MRYSAYFVRGESIEVLKGEDTESAEFRKKAGQIWFKDGSVELYLYDSRFNFWQQAHINHQDKLRTLGVVREEYIPPLVRMRHLIG